LKPALTVPLHLLGFGPLFMPGSIFEFSLLAAELLLQNVLRTPPQCKVRSKRLLGAARNALTGDRDLKMLRPARFEGKSTTPVTMDPSLSQRDASFLPQGALRILSRTISTIATIVAGILKKYDIT
jgi:hypothetical protein